jgi:hypothetical protein
MSVWLVIPTKKEAREVAIAVEPWKQKGYRIALFRDEGDAKVDADLIISGAYRGYPQAINQLCHTVFSHDRRAEWVCAAGDDMLPPDPSPDQIARECTEHFHGTFGVMQATGDPFGVDESGRCAAERICGSPFLGREFCARWNGDIGPFWPEFWHYFADEALHDELLMHSLLWQRKDLTIFHDHPSRTGLPTPHYMEKTQAGWAKDEAIFRARKAAGFPGHEPTTH